MRGIPRQASPTHRSCARARLLLLGGAAMLMLVAGCRQDMQNEPKMIPQRGTDFFADHRSVRPQVENTVARGQLGEGDYFTTGLLNGKEADLMPFPVTMQVLERGQERFNIYCSPCHSRVGNGEGMIVDRGYKPAANFHAARLLADPLSHYFFVMTNGYGAMPDYSEQLTPADRWTVAAYIRALQLSQDANASMAPPGVQIQNLKDIAAQEGYPESFAEPWKLPSSTAITTEPIDTSQGYPGMAPPNLDAPLIGNAQPAPSAGGGGAAAPQAPPQNVKHGAKNVKHGAR